MPKKKFLSREFKLEAIHPMEAGDKKAADLARELGIPATNSTSGVRS